MMITHEGTLSYLPLYFPIFQFIKKVTHTKMAKKKTDKLKSNVPELFEFVRRETGRKPVESDFLICTGESCGRHRQLSIENSVDSKKLFLNIYDNGTLLLQGPGSAKAKEQYKSFQDDYRSQMGGVKIDAEMEVSRPTN